MTRWDFFHRRESNGHDPRTVPCVAYFFRLPATMTLADALVYAYKNGLPKGSSRCGCVEVQNDRGIWSSASGGRINPKTATFEAWE